METKILSKGDSYKSEYCCSIIKIGEVKPIEGKDKIGYTLVNGETIVVRKDQVKEGDILIYASNETQLEKDFLSANNLFESSSFELNSNASEVEPYVLKNRELKDKVENIEKVMKKLLVCSKFMIDYESLYLAAESEDEKKELDTRLDNSRKTVIKYVGTSVNENSTLKDYVLESQKYCAEKKIEIDNLNSEIEGNANFIRSHTGFFNKTGRVRAIRLGGVRSMGYLFSLDELARYNEKVKDVNLEELVGEDFDTVDGKLFVKAYVPFVPERKTRGKKDKLNRRVERFDRMIKGEFSFHYDTQMFARCVKLFKPTDKVVITDKLHGTSVIIGKLRVKQPIPLPFYKRIWNWFVDLTGLFKTYRIKDYYVEYGNVTSSRKVIVNQYINSNFKIGFYGVDIWSQYGNLIYPYLDEGMTVYGEICGYVTGMNKTFQDRDGYSYDYGCELGKNFMMPYRITTTNEDGTKREWEVREVYEWTKELTERHPELAESVRPITILYEGTLSDLYPELDTDTHWHENLLEAMRNDKEHFGMEEDEPMCKCKVPREGIVIRKCNDEFVEAFKLKTERFLELESSSIDKGNVDIEMVLCSPWR